MTENQIRALWAIAGSGSGGDFDPNVNSVEAVQSYPDRTMNPRSVAAVMRSLVALDLVKCVRPVDIGVDGFVGTEDGGALWFLTDGGKQFCELNEWGCWDKTPVLSDAALAALGRTL